MAEFDDFIKDLHNEKVTDPSDFFESAIMAIEIISRRHTRNGTYSVSGANDLYVLCDIAGYTCKELDLEKRLDLLDFYSEKLPASDYLVLCYANLLTKENDEVLRARIFSGIEKIIDDVEVSFTSLGATLLSAENHISDSLIRSLSAHNEYEAAIADKIIGLTSLLPNSLPHILLESSYLDRKYGKEIIGYIVNYRLDRLMIELLELKETRQSIVLRRAMEDAIACNLKDEAIELLSKTDNVPISILNQIALIDRKPIPHDQIPVKSIDIEKCDHSDYLAEFIIYNFNFGELPSVFYEKAKLCAKAINSDFASIMEIQSERIWGIKDKPLSKKAIELASELIDISPINVSSLREEEKQVLSKIMGKSRKVKRAVVSDDYSI